MKEREIFLAVLDLPDGAARGRYLDKVCGGDNSLRAKVEEEPLPYLVMEFMSGETLQQRLDRVGPLDVPEVLRIGRQIAEGLAAAHATGLIHRDIKPGNVLLDDGPHMRVKITDFGLARAADDASVTQSGTIAGTPMYMAPEQARGHTLDQRADLFSFGTVLYQMVASRPPFRANSTLAVLKRVAEDTPRPIREIIPETPQWLCDIISKLQAKKPDDRFKSAREVADLLADCEAKLKAGQEVKNHFPVRATTRAGWKKWVGAVVILLAVAGTAITIHFLSPIGTWGQSPRGTITDKKRDFAVLSLRLNSTAIAYRIDGYGPNQTGVSVVQMPLEPGEHKVWFALGDRQFETAPFVVAAGQSAELELEVTSKTGAAFMNGQPLGTTPVPTHRGIP